MKPKLVIFDMDGLMFDTEKINGQALIEAARHYGYHISPELRLQMLGRCEKDNRNLQLATFGHDYPIDHIRQLTKQIKQEYITAKGLPVKPGLRELLDHLHTRQIKMAVASSSNREVITGFLKLSEVADYFDFIISGQEVAQSKPDPTIFLEVVKHFHLDVEQAWVLEDSQNGILAAINANIPVIWVPDLIDHDPVIKSLTYKTVETLFEVIDLVNDA